MSTNFKFRELRIQIKPGTTLVLDVTSLEEVKEVLALLKEQELITEHVPPMPSVLPSVNLPTSTDDPHTLVELKAGIPPGSLLAKKILAIKDGIPQLLRNNLFSNVTDAVLVLAYAIEIGLRIPRIPYDQFKPLFEAQSIKSGSSLALLLNNLKGRGYIDKKLYDTDRTISLSGKGAQKASDVLQAIAGKTE